MQQILTGKPFVTKKLGDLDKRLQYIEQKLKEINAARALQDTVSLAISDVIAVTAEINKL